MFGFGQVDVESILLEVVSNEMEVVGKVSGGCDDINVIQVCVNALMGEALETGRVGVVRWLLHGVVDLLEGGVEGDCKDGGTQGVPLSGSYVSVMMMVGVVVVEPKGVGRPGVPCEGQWVEIGTVGLECGKDVGPGGASEGVGQVKVGGSVMGALEVVMLQCFKKCVGAASESDPILIGLEGGRDLVLVVSGVGGGGKTSEGGANVDRANGAVGFKLGS